MSFPEVPLSKPLPETAEGLIEEMARRYPEVRYDPTMTDAEIRHALSRRSVYTELRDAYEFAKRRAP